MRVSFLLAFVLLTVPPQSKACDGPDGETYTILRELPTRLPKGAILLKVRLEGQPSDDQRRKGIPATVVNVVTGQFTGRTVDIVAANIWSSCSRFSQVPPGEPGYLIGMRRGNLRGRQQLLAVEYHPVQFRPKSGDPSVGLHPHPDWLR